jgi:hypothetical protein
MLEGGRFYTVQGEGELATAKALQAKTFRHTSTIR